MRFKFYTLKAFQFIALVTSFINLPVITCNHILNDVIRNLLVTIIVLNIFDTVINIFLGSLLLNECDFDFLAVGSQTVVVKSFSIFSTWVILTFATMIYEISRMRFYFAKHAFRIHKLSSCHISSQVILEASALSSLYLLTVSYFSSVTLFSNFPSVYNQVSGVNRSVDGLIFLAIFAANIVGLGYYYKLCKHVKKRVRKVEFVSDDSQTSFSFSQWAWLGAARSRSPPPPPSTCLR